MGSSVNLAVGTSAITATNLGAFNGDGSNQWRIFFASASLVNETATNYVYVWSTNLSTGTITDLVVSPVARNTNSVPSTRTITPGLGLAASIGSGQLNQNFTLSFDPSEITDQAATVQDLFLFSDFSTGGTARKRSFTNLKSDLGIVTTADYGSGNGIDADTLDGIDGSDLVSRISFSAIEASHTYYDDNQLSFGDDTDFSIYYDSGDNNTYMINRNHLGKLLIQAENSGDTAATVLEIGRSETIIRSDGTAALTVNGTGVTVAGNLTVQGTTTTVNSNTVEIGDNIIVLNSDEAGTPSQDAGIEVERGTSANVSVLWNETSDYWSLTNDGSNYYRILTTNDEGSGNGIDADTVDSIHASQFVRTDATSNIDTGVILYFGANEGTIRFLHDDAEHRFAMTPYDGGTYQPTRDFTYDADLGYWEFKDRLDIGGALNVTGTASFTAAITASTNPSAGTHVGNRDYNDARYFQLDATGNDVTANKNFANDVSLVFKSSVPATDAFIKRTTGDDLLIQNNGNILVKNAADTLFKVTDSADTSIFEVNTSTGQAFVSSSRILTVGDEGSGNGIDADTVDGIEGANIITDTIITNYSISPRFGSTIGMIDDPAVFTYDNTGDDTRTGYWTNTDVLEIRGSAGSYSNVVTKTGNLEVQENSWFIGKIGVAGQILASDGSAAAPGVSLQDHPDTGFYAATGNLGMAIDGSSVAILSAAGFEMQATKGPALLNETPSSTNPTLVPNRSNPVTGIGQGADNTLYLIINSTNIAEVDSTGITITGALNATQKSFVIDHPTKENYKLRYGSLEGPENGVYVRGRSKSHVIELPDYWIELVDADSITVSLTPMGKAQDIYVEKIENNRVYIKSKNLIKNWDFFYHVFAERKDVDKLEVEYKKVK